MNSNDFRQQARDKHLAGDTQAAVILLAQAISENPKDVLVALDMVQIFLNIGEIEQAQNLFNKLPESAQKLDIGVSISSQLNFINLAKNTAGKAILQEKVFKSPDDYQARFDLAVCLFAQHEIEQAMAMLFYIQENAADFKEGAAREMICNMLESTNSEEASKYRQKLANLINK
ncbi:FIG000875: Thioredoxin domain-containing protein EC-YbbN [uncultured Candidatus Thioglobus sp.]|nr:FIG000875: Thioredoxin domain-containing protein EC-YbbN [uncultured Candidatus Thioglobus sp.]